MDKATLRKVYLEKRQELDHDVILRKSNTIAQIFFDKVSLKGDEVIHVFLPILKNNEVDTWAIINKLKKFYPEITIVVSKTNFKDKVLVNYVLDENSDITLSKYGIPEPQSGEVIDDKSIDIVITPLLVTDEVGYRVGYGGGFYDRFFQNCRKDVIKVGVGLFPPIDHITDTHELDVRLDEYIYV